MARKADQYHPVRASNDPQPAAHGPLREGAGIIGGAGVGRRGHMLHAGDKTASNIGGIKYSL